MPFENYVQSSVHTSATLVYYYLLHNYRGKKCIRAPTDGLQLHNNIKMALSALVAALKHFPKRVIYSYTTFPATA